MLHKTFALLTIDLSMFGEGAPAGEGGAPAPAADAPAAAPEVRYGKQPGPLSPGLQPGQLSQRESQATAAPQTQAQTTEAPAPDKAKLFADLIKGEYKDQYTEATQKLINRRFRETDDRLKAMQPIVDLLDQRYGTKGDMTKLMGAIEGDRAYWQEAADEAGMSVEQFQTLRKLEAQNRRLEDIRQNQQRQYLAQQQYRKWEAEAAVLKQTYPDFDLEEAISNDMFAYLLRSGNYPMETAYKAAFADRIAQQAAAGAEKAVTDNIKARGSRPAEAGASAAAAFTVKDDVSKLTDEDVRAVLAQIANGGKVTFG